MGFCRIGRCKSESSVASASNFSLLLQETNPWPSQDQNPDLLSLLRSSLQKSDPCGPPRSRNPISLPGNRERVKMGWRFGGFRMDRNFSRIGCKGRCERDEIERLEVMVREEVGLLRGVDGGGGRDEGLQGRVGRENERLREMEGMRRGEMGERMRETVREKGLQGRE
ncbi:hypothetical protein AAC387_Pa06g2081 [Persea americana]